MSNRQPVFAVAAALLVFGACAAPPETQQTEEVEVVIVIDEPPEPEPEKPKRTPRQVTLRDRLLAGENLTTAQLERLARGEDRFAAWSYAERLRQTDPQNTLDAQTANYLKAARLGSNGAPERLSEILQAHGSAGGTLPAEAMVDAIETAALKGDDALGTALVEMLLRGGPISADEARATALAASRSTRADPDSAFAYARLLLASGAPVEGTVADLLTRATESENLTTQVTATQLLGATSSSDEAEAQDNEEAEEGPADAAEQDDDVTEDEGGTIEETVIPEV